jgi:hypothetical protein
VSHGTGRWLNFAVWLALLGFAASYGLNYGVSNHTFYLLPSVRLVHPEFWKNDWVVTQTHHYHFVFAWLAAGLLELDASGWLMAIANVVAIAGGMACLWRLLRGLGSETHAALAMLMVTLLATATRTGGPGTSYAFSDVFQPNTLGSVGVLAAGWLAVQDRPLASGLVLAVAGALHANYLVLCLPVFGVAQLAQPFERVARRLVEQLGPPLLVLLVYLPIMHTTSSSPASAEALRVYQDIRSPHHYRVENFAAQFAPWAGWQLIGVGSVLDLAWQRPQLRRLLGLLAGFWALIVPSALIAAAFVFRPLIQLYPWRLTPNCELFAQAAFALLVLGSVLSPSEWPLPGKRARLLLAVGFMLVAFGALRAKQPVPLVIGLVGLALLFGSARVLAWPGARERVVPALGVVLGVSLLLGSLPRLSHLSRSSSLLGGKNLGVAELCSWLDANTSQDSVLLTPPDEENIRFQCQRAIVIDWKTAPMVPDEVLAWYGRVEDVTGRVPFKSAADLAGYDALRQPRLAQLRQKYHFDFVVAYRGHELELGVAPAFRGREFVAYRLDPER